MRICYKREWNADADRMLTSKNSAKLKQYYYFHAEFLEEIRYFKKFFWTYIATSNRAPAINTILL